MKTFKITVRDTVERTTEWEVDAETFDEAIQKIDNEEADVISTEWDMPSNAKIINVEEYEADRD